MCVEDKELSDVKEYLKKEIIKTGYPLEVQIISFLRNSDWVALPQDYFFDDDSKTERNIDVFATPMPRSIRGGDLTNPFKPFTLNWFLAIECKKTIRNWVFFPIPEIVISCTGQYVDFLEAGNGVSFLDEVIPYRFGHYGRFKEVASTYAIFPEGKDEIFEAQMQLLKYISYQKAQRMREWKLEAQSKVMEFWFPIIVLEGLIWEARISNNQINVEPSEHVILQTSHRAPYQATSFRYTLDIVSKNFFKKLVKLIEEDIKDIENFLSPEIINNIIEKLKPKNV